MRILFAFAGGPGHGEPLVPVAAAAAQAGHDVLFAGRPSALESLAARGFRVHVTEEPRTAPRARKPLLPVDLERERRDFEQGFAGRGARAKAPRLVELFGTWRPDVVVCDESDFGSMIAAERFGIPHVVVLVIAARSFADPHLVAPVLDEIRADHGLPPDPDAAMVHGALTLAPFPPTYRDPVSPLPPRTHCYRPGPVPQVTRSVPPLVYFTLGTEFNVESGDLFPRVLAGLRELPAEVVVTVGRDIDPAELGLQPVHIRVEQFVPQAELLGRASLVVSHAGSGSVLGALQHGLPMVLMPMGADQPYNAMRCVELGVARSLDVIAATSEDVRDAAAAVLTEPAYRHAAEGLRDSFAELPGPESALAAVAQAAG
ncbi:MAG: glycosyltransferase [Actinomycetota bacterium]|nr:glycosyltransferase [Actinomycetota bacterium]